MPAARLPRQPKDFTMKLIKIARKKIEIKKPEIETKETKRAKKEKFAQYLIENAPECEKILRDELQRLGYNFIFQSVVFGYIADFHFPAKNKIVELDGKRFHDKAKDKIRDANLRNHGIITLRIGSHKVHRNLKAVVRAIDLFLGNSQKPPKVKKKKKKLYTQKPAWQKVPKVLSASTRWEKPKKW